MDSTAKAALSMLAWDLQVAADSFARAAKALREATGAERLTIAAQDNWRVPLSAPPPDDA